ncbi:MAG: GTPase HflX [Chloroflexi bacterium]|nr:GTPase HflX [Chloroflexota bacterium]
MPRPRSLPTRPEPERACLVSVAVRGQHVPLSLEESLDELGELARASQARVVRRVSQVLPKRSRTYLGSGKVDELRRMVKEDAVDVVIFDDELNPSQQRVLEEALDVKVIDRSGLILDVFAQRARTREGKLQTDLAQSEYLLPRLAGQWSHLERLGGGIGTRGPGEAQIETDRRIIRNKIARLKRDLEQVRQHRASQRRNRARGETRIVDLVGYTNAGKSALFNCLTDSSVLAKDQPFSTLDPTTRRVFLPSGAPAVLTDTVGFIHKLPSIVVAAFRATLEELGEADLLLHVVDLSHPLAQRHVEVVDGILEELGLADTPRILVMNKIDLVSEDPDPGMPGWAEATLASRSVLTSATRLWGIDRLRHVIDEELHGGSPTEIERYAVGAGGGGDHGPTRQAGARPV